MNEEKGWVVVVQSANGRRWYTASSFGRLRRYAIQHFLNDSASYADYRGIPNTWSNWYRRGYRVVKARLVWDEPIEGKE